MVAKNNRNVFSYCFGGQMSKIKVLAGLKGNIYLCVFQILVTVIVTCIFLCCLHITFSSEYLIYLCLCLIRTLVMTFRTHPDYP